jgi:transcriptional regulator with XRE-family HTH domain
MTDEMSEVRTGGPAGAPAMEADLGGFLRSRREAISPADVGLPTGSRRRTPGLRRAELATLAGISVDYLVRLEQGRDRNPSAQVLAALAGALRLDDDDVGYLRRLALCNAGGELCPSAAAPAREVRPQLRRVLDRLEPSPAFVMNHLTDLLAWTPTYERLVAPLGVLDGAQPNLVRFTFTDERARRAYPDWATIADEQVGNLIANGHPGDAQLRAFADELHAASAEFAARWTDRPVLEKRTGVKRLRHPDVGEVRVAFETLHTGGDGNQRLVVYLPADDASASAIDELAGVQPGNLRAVGG